MAKRLDAAFFGLMYSLAAAVLAYRLACGEIRGWAYAVLAGFFAFLAVSFAAKLALLAVMAERGE